jgi:cell division protein FtsB
MRGGACSRVERDPGGSRDLIRFPCRAAAWNPGFRRNDGQGKYGLALAPWLSENNPMSRTASPIQTLLRRAGLPAAALIAISFFAYNAVLGPTGVVVTKQLKLDIAQKQVEYAALEKKRAELKNRVDLLDPKRGADPDLVEEMARKQLNVVRPDEVIIPLKK